MNIAGRVNFRRLVRMTLSFCALVLLSLAFQNCKNESSDLGVKLHQYQTSDIPINFYLEKPMSNKLKQTIIGDLVWYKNRQGFESTPADSYANLIFGNSTQQHLDYLDTRINYAIEGEGSISEDLFILAANPSVLQWMKGLSEGKIYRNRIDDELITFDSGRAGLVVFYEYHKLRHRADRVITLAHEARHSDCTGGLPASFINHIPDFLAGLTDSPYPSCGHFHTRCPNDHNELAGIIACDQHLWGAYSIGAVLGQVFNQLCSNCSEADRQIALAVTADSFSRVLGFRDIVNGIASDPDMSSTGLLTGQ